MEKHKANENFLKASADLSKTKLHYHTMQFLIKNEKPPFLFKPYGSGVLVQTKDEYLIFTASHVTQNMHINALYVNTRVGIQVIIGKCYETDYKKDSNVDLAYIILDRMLGRLLAETYDFLPVNRIIHSHIPVHGTNYMVSGYPEKSTWEDSGDRYYGSSHYLLHMANEKVFAYYNFDIEKNYILSFSGRGIDTETGDKTSKIDDPYGISGCGLWYLNPTIFNETIGIDYFLIGIMVMFKKGKYHILVGNRIELIMNSLQF